MISENKNCFSAVKIKSFGLQNKIVGIRVIE